MHVQNFPESQGNIGVAPDVSSEEMSSLGIAAQLNNSGADFLCVGDLRNARELFRNALTVLTSCSVGELVYCPSDGNQSLSSLIGSALDVSQTPPDRVEVPTTMLVYSQAVPVPQQDAPFSTCEGLNQSLSSACCIFNLGLIYHFRGMQTGGGSGNQREHLLAARSLYDKCIRLVFEHGVGCYVATHPVLDLLSMASLNNQAHVSHELACFETTKYCIACLHRVASLVVPSMYTNPHAEAVIQQAKQNFSMNIAILRPPTGAHAA